MFFCSKFQAVIFSISVCTSISKFAVRMATLLFKGKGIKKMLLRSDLQRCDRPADFHGSKAVENAHGHIIFMVFGNFVFSVTHFG
jgi:hypothetical protein